MNSRHYSELETAIQRWMDKACCEDEWSSTIIGDKTVEIMAQAARNVFEACEESQEYAVRHGYLSEGCD